jgi:hypothetical protein
MTKKILLLLALFAPIAYSTATAAEDRPIPVRAIAQEAHAKNLRATYRIRIVVGEYGDSQIITGYATGVAIDPNHILTAGHVFKPGASYFLDIHDPLTGVLSHAFALTYIAHNDADALPSQDLALFKVDQPLVNFINLHYNYDPKPGATVYTIGARRGINPYFVEFGFFVSQESEFDKGLWTLSLHTAPGNSGGAIFDGKHRFLGILVRGAPDGVILFVPASVVEAFIKAHKP